MRKKKHIKRGKVVVVLLLLIAVITFLIVINNKSKEENKNIGDTATKDDIAPEITLTGGEKVIVVKRR